MRLYPSFINKVALASVSFFLFLNGCITSLPDKNRVHKVSWSSEYRMAEYLAEPVKVRKKADLQQLLELSWYSSFDVLSVDKKRTVLNNCLEYFNLTKEVVGTIPAHDYKFFLFLARMCRAAEALIHAEDAKYSYIPSHFIDKSMFNNFPKEMAFQISNEDVEKVKSPKNRYWSDIEKGLKFEFIKENQARFSGNGGRQVVSLMGRGDFNNDNIEDVLLSIQETVVSGTYSNFRALVLSVDQQGHWYFVKEFIH